MKPINLLDGIVIIAVVALGLYRKEILGILGRIIKAIKFGGIE